MSPSDEFLLLFERSWLGWLFAGLWGALWGSFYNVCIHRLGLYESVVRPRSRCPRCGNFLRAVDNIPILSWLLLRGRCHFCALPISVRYPLVELLGLGLGLAVWGRFVASSDGDPVQLLARFFVYHAFAGTLLVLAGIDLDHLLIPDEVTYPGVPVLFGLSLLVRDVPPQETLVGIVVGYGLVALVAEASFRLLGREGMGYGDAKLLAMVGALLGWRAVVVAFFGAPFVGLLVVIPLLLRRRAAARRAGEEGRILGVEVPYGPYLVLATWGYLLLGQWLPEPLWFGVP